jgi:hypothetical protein
MVAQLRLLDPSISAEIGTPERKIIDTVAQNLYENQIDLDSLSAGLDIDSKYGAQLDRFLSIFGFARQKATFATGFVTFSRTTAANVDIRIPAGSTIQAPALSPDQINTGDVQNADVIFSTLYDVTLSTGSTSSDPVPVRSTVAGTIGNVAAERISAPVGNPIFGITSVTNETATKGGKDSESDEEFKVRFKNTVFRNLAGTEDQYMALAIATAYTTRANVVGPQSHYREYVQIPSAADNANWDVDGNGSAEPGNGNAGEYTTALSTIPYAKYIYAVEFPAFVSNGQAGISQAFFRQDSDFIFNSPPTAAGDTFRISSVGLDLAAASAPLRPNVTFKNVYLGADGTVEAVRPGDVVLLEYSYMSEASRNSVSTGIDNAIDVFIDGGNIATASTVTVRPTTATAFIDSPNSKFHYENFRRVGQPEKRPLIGNVLMPMFWQPMTDVPEQIIIGTVTYFKGVHYWAVEDTSSLGGTIRSRAGIEWSTKQNGKAQSDNTSDPSLYTGKIVTDPSGDPVGGQAVEVDLYSYDRNIVDLQAALEGSRQITTDALAHRAKKRYFKLDVTVMYTPGVSTADVNLSIREAVDGFLRSQYFGSAIQLSDLLSVIHNVTGVDNVRWSNETNTTVPTRIWETDASGLPLTNIVADRVQVGTASRPEIQGLYLSGQPTSGSVVFRWGGNNSTALTIPNFTQANLLTTLNTMPGLGSIAVTEDTRTATGVRYPMRSFRISWASIGNGSRELITPLPSGLAGGPYILKNDFFLRDDELAALPTDTQPGDTVAGLIIRPRAQNTWVRTN